MKTLIRCLALTALVGSFACGGLADEGSADTGPEALVDAGIEACDPSDEEACSGDLICLVDRCVPAYGRSYRLSIVSAQIGEKDGAGNGWDGRGGAPDPGVLIFVDEQLVGSVPSQTNTYEPVFLEAFDLRIDSAETHITMRLFDEDGGGGSEPWEFIGDFEFDCSMVWLRRLATQQITRHHGSWTNTLTFGLVPLGF